MRAHSVSIPILLIPGQSPEGLLGLLFPSRVAAKRQGLGRSGASCHQGEVVSSKTGQSAPIQASSPHRAPTLCLLLLPWAFPSWCGDFALLLFVPELGYAQLRCINLTF